VPSSKRSNYKHAPKNTRKAIVNVNQPKPSSRQPHVERIDHQLVPDSLTLLHYGITRRFALRLATDLLAGAGRRSERPGAVGQPVRFSEPIHQTQDNAREPEPERDFEMSLRALRGEGEEFYLVGLRNTYSTHKPSEYRNMRVRRGNGRTQTSASKLRYPA